MQSTFSVRRLPFLSYAARPTPQTSRTPSWRIAVEALEPDLLQPEDSGAAVRNLQLALQALSLYCGPINGHFDSATTDAVRMLQTILEVDNTGVFDQATWYALTFWAEPSL